MNDDDVIMFMRGRLTELMIMVALQTYQKYIAIKKGKKVWHVDDLKILHKSGWELTKMIKLLAKIYGEIKDKRGKVHKYYGMDLDYNKPG